MGLSNYDLSVITGLHNQYRRRAQDQYGQSDEQMVNAISTQREAQLEMQKNDQQQGK